MCNCVRKMEKKLTLSVNNLPPRSPNQISPKSPSAKLVFKLNRMFSIKSSASQPGSPTSPQKLASPGSLSTSLESLNLKKRPKFVYLKIHAVYLDISEKIIENCYQLGVLYHRNQ